MSSDPDAAPINPLPVAVVVLALPMILIELIFLAGSEGFVGGPEAVGWRLQTLERHGFFVSLFDHMVQTGTWSATILSRFVTYPFLHWSFTHMIMALVFLLALGKMVGDVFGSFAVFVIFFAASIAGAIAYALLTSAQAPLVGAYPGVYGLIGGYSFILWVHARATGGQQHRAFALIAVLLFVQLVFGLAFGSGLDWVAEIAGFVAGFLVSFLVAPGGFGRIVALLRQR